MSTAPTQDQFIAWAANQPPGVILQAIESYGINPLLNSNLANGVDAARNMAWNASLSAGQAANAKQAKNIELTVAAAMGATGVLAPMGVALAAFSQFQFSSAGSAFVKAWTSGTSGDIIGFLLTGGLNFLSISGGGVSCKPAGQAKGAPPLLDPSQLYDFPIQPQSLASLIIPTLCHAWLQFENCEGFNNTGSISWMVPTSNVVIASIAHLWNQNTSGPRIDYFAPYVPSGPSMINQGWGGWNGYGVINSAQTQWAFKPPFVAQYQAQYAYKPLSMVPTSIANPATENITSADGGIYGPGGAWSRISANAGPMATPLEAGFATAAWCLVALGAAAMAAPYLSRKLTGRSLESNVETGVSKVRGLLP